MKTSYIYKGVAALMMAFTLTACEDMFGNFLDKEPSNELTGEQTFSDWATMEQFHWDTYNFLRNGECYISNSWLDAATDLAETSYSNAGTRVSFNIGNYYTTSAAAELTTPWESRYRGIRKCNMLLERIDNVPQPTDISEEDYQKKLRYYKGEARTLRVWFYWELFLRYGPVPLVTKVLDPDGDLLSGYTQRPSIQEYAQFLIQELNDSYALVMEKAESDESGNQGRINKPIVLALKSRILLYMASPRFASQSGYTWADAADAAKEFIDLYGDTQVYQLNADYTNAILQNAHDQGNPEVIFYRSDLTQGWGSYGYYNDVPVGYGGNGGLCPSQNLIDMYDMINGQSPFTTYDATGAPVYASTAACPTVNVFSGYDDQHPTANRDPRLDATILYQGVNWSGRAIDVVYGGTDNPVGNANATPTGYYVRKYMPEVILQNNHTGSSYRNWIILRYAEILLNYAEALNELGNGTQALQVLQQLRDRAGLTYPLTNRTDLNSQTAIRNFIHKERTIELAFEEHRPWDVRRWGVAKEALGRDIIGVSVAADGTYTRKVAQNRVFEDRMYLYPIPETESWKTGIDNNEGWN